MTFMYRIATMVIALLILTGGGLAHGIWAERWQSSSALQDAAARVRNVPLEIGDWQGRTLGDDAEVFAQAGALAYWTRSYVHPHRPTSLLVILMCGRPGRMAVHTPEVCYHGAGFSMAAEPKVVTLKSAQGSVLGNFWTARFFKETGLADDLRLIWAWNDGQGWRAPTNPRWEFGGQPFLYKLYLSQDSSGATAPAGGLTARRSMTTEAVQDFTRQFLPKLQLTLFEKKGLE
jgi:hypothetical protein